MDQVSATSDDNIMAKPGDMPVTARVLPDHDWFLVHLVEMTSDGIGVGVTLHVGGLIICGEMISGSDYFKEFSDKMRAADYGDEVAEQNKQILADQFASFSRLTDRPEDAGDDWVSPRPAFIHLRNARVYSAAGSPIPLEGALWRGRITAVDAFASGTLSRNAPSSTNRSGLPSRPA